MSTFSSLAALPAARISAEAISDAITDYERTKDDRLVFAAIKVEAELARALREQLLPDDRNAHRTAASLLASTQGKPAFQTTLRTALETLHTWLAGVRT